MSKQPLPLLPSDISNLMKGGDFMGREILQGPVTPAQGRVENGSNPSTHPLRKGRIRSALEIAEITDPTSGQPVIDRVALFSVMSMDGRE